MQPTAQKPMVIASFAQTRALLASAPILDLTTGNASTCLPPGTISFPASDQMPAGHAPFLRLYMFYRLCPKVNHNVYYSETQIVKGLPILEPTLGSGIYLTESITRVAPSSASVLIRGSTTTRAPDVKDIATHVLNSTEI